MSGQDVVRRWIVVASAIALVVMASAPAAAQGGQPNLLAAENATAGRIRDQFQAFERQAAALGRKGRVSKEELETLSRQAETLKRQLPDLERLATSARSKLQGAGLWTEQLDRNVADALQKGGKTALLQELQAAGGARRVIDAVASGSGAIGSELDRTVNGLQAKSTAWQRLLTPVLEALTGVPVEARSVRTVSLFQAALCLYQGIYGAYCGL